MVAWDTLWGFWKKKKMKKNKVIILAAGKGTRLGELCKDKPKCLLEIGDRTLLDVLITPLLKCRVDDIILVLGYKKEKIEEYVCEKGYPRVRFVYNHFYETTDNADSVAIALSSVNIDSDSVILLDGDIFFDYQLIKNLVDDPAENLIVIDDSKKIEEEDCKVLFENGFAKRIGKKVDGNSVYTSMVKMSGDFLKSFFREISKKRDRREWYSEPLDRILVQSPETVKVIATHNLIRGEIDTTEDLLSAKELIKKLGEFND